jgi:hypothetical protein
MFPAPLPQFSEEDVMTPDQIVALVLALSGPPAAGRQTVRACLDEIAANGADISSVNTPQSFSTSPASCAMTTACAFFWSRTRRRRTRRAPQMRFSGRAPT